jgi:hypothetical protein
MTYQRPGVYISETLLPAQIAATSSANAAGAAVGEFAQGPTSVTLVTSWYDFVKRFGGYNVSYPATFGVGQFFQNGGSELYVRRVVHTDAVKASIVVPHTTNGTDTMATVTAKDFGSDGNNLRIQFTAAAQSGYFDLTVYKEGGNTPTNVADDIILERYTNVVVNDRTSGDFVESVVNNASNAITISVSDLTKTPTTAVLPLVNGADGSAATATDYSGAVADFGAIDRPLVVFAPEVIAKLGSTNATTVHNALIAWADSTYSFAVIDTPAISAPSTAVPDALDYAAGLTSSSHAAVYFPNYYITDPVGRSLQSLRKVAPASAIAGLYIQTDKQSGPFKAPAGLNAGVKGALALEKLFTSSELDALNSGAYPINALRNLPGAGVVSMGARTLLQDGTSNKYVNMRRSLNYIEKSLNDLTQFALFENNNEDLWARIQTTISVFLNAYRNQGGLRGTTPAQAYFVKVDAENNTAQTIANGEVHIQVGVALQYPAEFVVINISQKTAN